MPVLKFILNVEKASSSTVRLLIIAPARSRRKLHAGCFRAYF